MKHLVVRTDIRKRLKGVQVVLADSNIFLPEMDLMGIGELIEKLTSNDLQHLFTRDIKLILFNKSGNGNSGSNYTENGHIIYENLNGTDLGNYIDNLCASTGISVSDIVLINSVICDKKLLSKVGFSVSTMDAPLDVRSNSYYLSNFKGADTFNEVVDLIIKCNN